MRNQHESMGLLHVGQNTQCFHRENTHAHIRNDTVIIKVVNQQARVCKRRPTSVKDGCSSANRFSDTIMFMVISR
jgi:hypothetical protein